MQLRNNNYAYQVAMEQKDEQIHALESEKAELLHQVS